MGADPAPSGTIPDEPAPTVDVGELQGEVVSAATTRLSHGDFWRGYDRFIDQVSETGDFADD